MTVVFLEGHPAPGARAFKRVPKQPPSNQPNHACSPPSISRQTTIPANNLLGTAYLSQTWCASARSALVRRHPPCVRGVQEANVAHGVEHVMALAQAMWLGWLEGGGVGDPLEGQNMTS